MSLRIFRTVNTTVANSTFVRNQLGQILSALNCFVMSIYAKAEKHCHYIIHHFNRYEAKPDETHTQPPLNYFSDGRHAFRADAANGSCPDGGSVTIRCFTFGVSSGNHHRLEF